MLIYTIREEDQTALEGLEESLAVTLQELPYKEGAEFASPLTLAIPRDELHRNRELRRLCADLLDADIDTYVAYPGKGCTHWDNMLEAKGPKRVLGALAKPERVTQESLSDFLRGSEDENDVIEYFNRRHAIVRVGRKEAILTRVRKPEDGSEGVEFQSQQDLALRYKNWSVGNESAVNLWLCSPERVEYDGVVFAPGEPRTTRNNLNLFTGWAVEPVEGDCSLLWQHLEEVVCAGSKECFEYMMKWAAHLFQKPQERPEVAPVLIGGQGGGKGTFVDALGGLLGSHYLVAYNMGQIAGRFNAHLREALLISANEALWDSGKRGVGALKGLITDHFFPLEAKGVDIQLLANYRRVIVSSNEDIPVTTDMDDRRFLVLRVSDHHKGDRQYFRAIHEQLNNGGREALLYDLQNLDLDGFDPRDVPRTDEAFKLKMRSADSVVNWWRNCLADGSLLGLDPEWLSEVPCQRLFEAYTKWCDRQGLRKEAQNVFGTELARLLEGTSFTRRRPGSGSSRPWTYSLPELPAAREAFERYVKTDPNIWPEQEED